MPMLSQPAFGPKLSIGFITGGTLIDVWTLVWRYTLMRGQELTPNQQFMFWGLLLTGATFLIIGIFLGQIGRAARKAEMPPVGEGTQAEATIQATAAAHPPAVAAVQPGMTPGMTPGTAMPAAPAVPQAAAPAGVVPGVVR